MATSDFSLLAADRGNTLPWLARRRKWWSQLTSRCAGPDCPQSGKLWPSRLHKSEGIIFDGRWYCCRGCLEAILGARVHTLLSSFHIEKPRAHRLPIGLLLVNRGVISPAQLREAIRLQREAGHGKLGDWLRQTAGLGDQQLTAALGQQWGCPVFPLEHQVTSATWSDLIPLPLLLSAGAVPAYASSDGRVLHLAFGERVDHTLLYAAEQMLLCRTFPCVASGHALQAKLEQFRRLTSGMDTCFDTIRESSEMTWTIGNYAVELKAKRLVLARAGSYIWVRFFRDQSSRDLLFRILPDNNSDYFERLSARTKAFSASADGRKGGVSNASTSL
ncbi:MAG TPA: hypothetical protein VMI32_08380 [Candidatus Solibacter sp.]|nr:hypothetical protein [Candidatus Solibacter sp.]